MGKRTRLCLQKFRTCLRLARAGLHLLWAVLTVCSVFPWASVRRRRRLKSRWSRQLLEILGVRLSLVGPAPAAGLLVSNHISWLDIYALNAMAPTSFVAKSEVQAWPLIGWLSRKAETIFLQRGSRAAAMRTKTTLVGELRRGSCVGLFAEGTTSDGSGVLPFHSALFQAAVDAEARVIPTAIRYTDRARALATAPAYVGQTTLWQCLLRIADADGLTAVVVFLPSIAAAGGERRQLAERAHRLVSKALADQLETAVEVLDDAGAAVHPIAAIDVGQPIDLAQGGGVDVTADDAVEATLLEGADDAGLEVEDEGQRVLDPSLGVA